ncbi:MAG: hypothetical protein ACJAWO_000798, partial [Halieaceae bacterium]
MNYQLVKSTIKMPKTRINKTSLHRLIKKTGVIIS